MHFMPFAISFKLLYW